MEYTYHNSSSKEQYVVIEPHFDEFYLAAGEKLIISTEDNDPIDIYREINKYGTIILCLNYSHNYKTLIVSDK